jgi:tetratricopeptide (TPR) repeat protein
MEKMSKALQGRLWAVLAALMAAGYLHGETNRFPEFRLETSRDYLRTLAGSFPADAGTNAQTLFLQAWLQSQLGDKAEAERLAHRALECDPRRADIDVFLAQLLIREDHLDEAAACLRDAVKIQPSTKGAYRRLGMVLERLGDGKGAQDAFTEAARQTPDDPITLQLLGKSLLERGQVKEAVGELEKSCQLDPQSANPFYTLFQAQTKLGNREAAQRALDEFKRLKQVEKQGMGTGADDGNYDNAQEMRSFTADIHAQIARLLIAQGQAALAEAHLRQALAISPRQVNALETLGTLYLRTGRLTEARPLLEQLVELRPRQVSDAVNLGTLLLQLKDYRPAVAQLKRALQLDGDQVQALNNLARFYLSSKVEVPEALALCQRLVAVAPEAENYDLLGWAYYANGQLKDALAATAQAVAKEPGNAAFVERHRRLTELSKANR